MKIKNPLNNFHLSHIAWFFSGVVITVVFNWIVFKDPKRITAAGVSTLVAASAFLLALWSAFKVNKWLVTKINETAYKQAENSMIILRNLLLDLFHISHCFKRLRIANEENGEYDRIANELEPRFKSYIENINQLLITIESLPSWNIFFIQKNILKESSSLMKEYQISSIIKTTIALLTSDKIKHDKKRFIRRNAKDVIIIFDTVSYRLNALLKMPYHKKFEHLSYDFHKK